MEQNILSQSIPPKSHTKSTPILPFPNFQFSSISLHLNANVCAAYFLPEWCPASTYVREAKAIGLEDVRQVHLI